MNQAVPIPDRIREALKRLLADQLGPGSGWLVHLKRERLGDACSNKPYAQCGGTTWKGETCCPDGWACTGSGYYYQCTKASASLRGTGFRPRFPAADCALPKETRYELHSARQQLPSV